MLPARFVFLIPRCQRCRDSKILVTIAFCEADSRHAGELSVFFREKANSELIHIGEKVEKKSSKALHQSVSLKSVFAAVFFATGDPLLPIGQTVGRLWACAPRDTNRE